MLQIAVEERRERSTPVGAREGPPTRPVTGPGPRRTERRGCCEGPQVEGLVGRVRAVEYERHVGRLCRGGKGRRKDRQRGSRRSAEAPTTRDRHAAQATEEPAVAASRILRTSGLPQEDASERAAEGLKPKIDWKLSLK